MASIGKFKVGFIGIGKLGQACAEMVAEVHDVVGYDISPRTPENFSMVSTLAEAVQGRDIVFVAVETPHDPQYDGKAPTSHLPNKDFDYSVVKHVLSQVNAVATKDQLVVLISTVLPGTVRRELIQLISNARFVYNPYLIAMGTVKWDMVNPEMVMIGTEDGSESGDAKELVDFYKTIMQNTPRYVIGTWDECECIKVFYNTFISAKVSLVNMIQDVAEKQGNINAELVCDALANSGRRIMGPGYMKPGMGDGGACVLPDFPVIVNGVKTSISMLYDSFDNSKDQTFLVKSANYSLSVADEKKVFKATCRSYEGEILVFTTESGQILECTPEHLLPVEREGKRTLLRADEVVRTDKLYSV
jgi:UDPglucose 6-dehydrogenase